MRAFLREWMGQTAPAKRARSWSGFNPEFSKALGARGWIGMTWPKKYGGHERSYAERYVVLEESLILSVLGFLPGAALAWGLYAITVKATNLPLQMTWARGALIFGLTVVMCGLSAMLAMRKLRQANPADVF